PSSFAPAAWRRISSSKVSGDNSPIHKRSRLISSAAWGSSTLPDVVPLRDPEAPEPPAPADPEADESFSRDDSVDSLAWIWFDCVEVSATDSWRLVRKWPSVVEPCVALVVGATGVLMVVVVVVVPDTGAPRPAEGEVVTGIVNTVPNSPVMRGK